MRKAVTIILTAAFFAASGRSQTKQLDCTDESNRPECKAAMAKQKLDSVLKSISETKAGLDVMALKSKLSAAEFGVMGAIVKGAPYSAEAITESVLTLGDGNRIRHNSSVLVFRDSEGRTARQDNATHQTVIMDPVANVSYAIDTEKQTAYQRPLTVSVKAYADKMAAEITSKTLADIKRGTRETIVIQPEKQLSHNESLGQMTIEGIVADGTRSTLVIPADTVGNERPIETVSERWYSPDLKIDVMTERIDPRTGDVTFRLTNIRRGEPDRSVFEVPPGFTVEPDSSAKKPSVTRK